MGLSQEEFAQKIFRGKSTISQLENDKKPLTPSLRSVICRTFGAREEWLVEGAGEMINSFDSPGIKEVSYGYGARGTFTEPPRHSAAALMPIPGTNETGIDPCIQAMADIKEIFKSEDPILIPAIRANLHAFKRALQRERQLEMILFENQDLKKRMSNLENLCKDIPTMKEQFETLKAENRTLRTENNRLKSTYEDPDGDNGHPTTDTEKKAM